MGGFDGVGDTLLEVRALPDVPAGGDVDVTVMVKVGDGAAFGDEVLRESLLIEGDRRGANRRGEEEGGEESHGGISNTPNAPNGCEVFLAQGLFEAL